MEALHNYPIGVLGIEVDLEIYRAPPPRFKTRVALGIRVCGVFSLFLCRYVFLILPGWYVKPTKSGSQAGTMEQCLQKFLVVITAGGDATGV